MHLHEKSNRKITYSSHKGEIYDPGYYKYQRRSRAQSKKC